MVHAAVQSAQEQLAESSDGATEHGTTEVSSAEDVRLWNRVYVIKSTDICHTSTTHLRSSLETNSKLTLKGMFPLAVSPRNLYNLLRPRNSHTV